MHHCLPCLPTTFHFTLYDMFPFWLLDPQKCKNLWLAGNWFLFYKAYLRPYLLTASLHITGCALVSLPRVLEPCIACCHTVKLHYSNFALAAVSKLVKVKLQHENKSKARRSAFKLSLLYGLLFTPETI